MKYKVKALDTYERLGITDKNLKTIVKTGTEFEVDEDRLRVLTGENTYRQRFVEIIKSKKKAKDGKIQPKVDLGEVLPVDGKITADKPAPVPIPVPTDPTITDK